MMKKQKRRKRTMKNQNVAADVDGERMTQTLSLKKMRQPSSSPVMKLLRIHLCKNH